MDDQQILTKLKERDQQTFIEIVNTYKRKIIALCYSYTEDKFEAEDLSQEVFITFYKGVDKFRGDCSISTYLYKIAVSKCIDFKRKKSIKSMLSFKFEDKGKCDDLDDKVFVRQCIKALPKDIKIPVVLYYYAGLSQAEISDILNISPKAVEGRIYRGKQKLKIELKREGAFLCSNKTI